MSPDDIHVGRESTSERIYNDMLVSSTLDIVSKNLCLNPDHSWLSNFHEFYESAASKCFFSKSSVTTRMARLLFAIGSICSYKRVAIVGSAEGSALIWLSAPNQDAEANIIGVDLSEKRNDVARLNISNLDISNISILNIDGSCLHEMVDYIDLLLIDTYSSRNGKYSYSTILESLESKIREGGIIVAHDVSYPKFRNEMATYLCIVRDKSRFSYTVSVELDSFGLEITKK